ncbi:MAG TPA: hypothetical protein ENI23_17125 [bacterium]|nr:hypothetical protein [bacterium]
MTLESKVTSLPLSRKLTAAFKEKGIKLPESVFEWEVGGELSGKSHSEKIVLVDRPTTFSPANTAWSFHPAYLSDELLAGMPVIIHHSEFEGGEKDSYFLRVKIVIDGERRYFVEYVELYPKNTLEIDINEPVKAILKQAHLMKIPYLSPFTNKFLPNACAEMTIWLIDNGYYE